MPTSTKQQELDALATIRAIVDRLGKDSYVATAFKRVWDYAKQNIEFDAAFSLADELDAAREREDDIRRRLLDAEGRCAEQARQINSLEQQLEREERWEPHESDLNVKQADYDRLAQAGSTRTLADEEALRIVVDEYGFDPARVTILHSVPKEEIDRHRRVRKVGEIDRPPLYNATDWNYIRFDVAGWYYEMHNGALHQFYQ
jgi:hypothetical protein